MISGVTTYFDHIKIANKYGMRYTKTFWLTWYEILQADNWLLPLCAKCKKKRFICTVYSLGMFYNAQHCQDLMRKWP